MIQLKSNETVQIQMLGGFTIKMSDKLITDDVGRSRQVWNLLGYLILNRHSDVSKERLIDLLWDNENCNDPANALKNLVYRARMILSEICDNSEHEFILLKRNIYSWNNSLPTCIDIEQFENAYHTAQKTDIADEIRVAHYKSAIDLYRGDFLPKSSLVEWVTAINAYYKNIFVGCVIGLSNILLPQKKFDTVMQICKKAISIDALEEPVHQIIIRTYILSGSYNKAVLHYRYAEDLFYSKLGVKLSEEIQELIAHMSDRVKVESNFDNALKELDAGETGGGAYFCDYETFKNIYRIAIRQTDRRKKPIFVALITLRTGAAEKEHLQDSEYIQNKMEQLKTTILSSLRKSDIVAQFSCSQYIILLPTLILEDGEKVLNRIVKRFNKVSYPGKVTIRVNLNPIERLQ